MIMEGNKGHHFEHGAIFGKKFNLGLRSTRTCESVRLREVSVLWNGRLKRFHCIYGKIGNRGTTRLTLFLLL